LASGIETVADLQAALSLTLDNHVAVRLRQFDSPDMAPETVKLLRDLGCTLEAVAILALNNRVQPHRSASVSFRRKP